MSSMPVTPKIYPVILSGGAGKRLWPMSRTHYPKQLLPLYGSQSLLQQTALRLSDNERYNPPLVIANEAHRFIVAEQLGEIGLRPQAIVLEPAGRNTAPAAAAAALLLERLDPGAIMALLPSDHVIRDAPGFQTAMSQAVAAADKGHLVTFGIEPDRAETGYGYIEKGEAIAGAANAHHVAEFVEKPDLPTAESYLASGKHLWNSGMFVMPVAVLLAEMRRLCPEIVAAVEAALAGAEPDLDFQRLETNAFSACPSDSIDYAVMERTDQAAVVPANFGWNDVGAWHALCDLAEKTDEGNAILGDVVARDSSGCYLRSEDGRLVAAIGLTDMILISTADAVMAVPRDRAGEVKDLVEQLEADDRSEVVHHRRVYRPWGNYMDTDAGNGFRSKRIVVKPGAQLSLQRHKHRSEHWVVVRGRARVTLGEDTFDLEPNQSTFIPKGVVHRLENHSDEPLHLIEVQVGDYLGEDDIERLEDTYGRTHEKPEA